MTTRAVDAVGRGWKALRKAVAPRPETTGPTAPTSAAGLMAARMLADRRNGADNGGTHHSRRNGATGNGQMRRAPSGGSLHADHRPHAAPVRPTVSRPGYKPKQPSRPACAPAGDTAARNVSGAASR